jgi:hypothetical protein
MHAVHVCSQHNRHYCLQDTHQHNRVASLCAPCSLLGPANCFAASHTPGICCEHSNKHTFVAQGPCTAGCAAGKAQQTASSTLGTLRQSTNVQHFHLQNPTPAASTSQHNSVVLNLLWSKQPTHQLPLPIQCCSTHFAMLPSTCCGMI